MQPGEPPAQSVEIPRFHVPKDPTVGPRQLAFRVSDEFLKRLDRLAKERDVPPGTLARHLIGIYLGLVSVEPAAAATASISPQAQKGA